MLFVACCLVVDCYSLCGVGCLSVVVLRCSLFVVCSLLLVVDRWLLRFGFICSLFAVGCRSFGVYCVLCVAWLLLVVRCSLLVAGCSLRVACCLLRGVC